MTTELDSVIKNNRPIEIYQDILINNKLYRKGVRECSDRYLCIKNNIKITKRRFTILDIGANFGYYSLQLLRDFPNAFIVMIQPYKEGKFFKEICKLNTMYNDRIILLDMVFSAKNMKLLSECEHFDYVICNNILHHFKDEWLDIYNYVKKHV